MQINKIHPHIWEGLQDLGRSIPFTPGSPLGTDEVLKFHINPILADPGSENVTWFFFNNWPENNSNKFMICDDFFSSI